MLEYCNSITPLLHHSNTPPLHHSTTPPMKLRLSTNSQIFRQRHNGFTLVEMLLVLVILGVLAAIVYPKVAGRGEQARVTSTQTQIAAFKTALDAFEVDNGYYPKGRNGLQDLVVKPREAVNWRGPYLESIPKDPWQNDYIYECPGKHNVNSYDIMSMGSDGRSGTEDDICNWQTGR
jgi:general secretion pathway protein G